MSASPKPQVDADAQRRYWDGVTRRRTPAHPAVRACADGHLRFAWRHVAPALVDAGHWLEIGAGNGYVSAALAARLGAAAQLWVSDFALNMLRRHPGHGRHAADAQRLPLADDAVDVVVCANLLHHLPSPGRAVKEMARVARRQVVLIEPNTLNPLMALFGLLVPEERGTLAFTPAHVRRLGAAAGLALRAHAVRGAILPNKTPTALVPLLRPLDRIDWPLIGFYQVAVFDVAGATS